MAIASSGCAQLLGLEDPEGGAGDDDAPPSCALVPSYAPMTSYGVGVGGGGVAGGDLDDDSLNDVVVGAAGHMTIWHGSGGPSLTRSEELPLPGGCTEVRDLAISDIDGDGYADLVFSAADPCGTSVYLQDPGAPGSFLPARPVMSAGAMEVGQLALGELSGDALVDVVVHESGAMWLAVQDPAMPGTFMPAVAIGGVASYMTAVTVTDLDEDNDDDVVYLGMDEQITILFQTAPATFSPPRLLGPVGNMNFAAGDLTADGREDLLAVGLESSLLLEQVAGSPGSFQGAGMIAAPGEGISPVLVLDVNEDGRSDIVTFQGVLFQCAAPSPGGEFTSLQPELGLLPTFVDLDADGLLDAAYRAGGGDLGVRLREP